VVKKSLSRIITFCESINHQSTLAKVGDFWEKKGISPDPFGGYALNPEKRGWGTRLAPLV